MVAEEQEIQEPKAEKPAKSKKKMILGLAIFSFTFILFTVANYFYLRATYVPPPPPPPPVEKHQVLSIDLTQSDEESERAEAQADSAAKISKQAAIAAADSMPRSEPPSATVTEVLAAGESAATENGTDSETELTSSLQPAAEAAKMDSATLKRSAKLAKIVENMPAEDAASMLEALSDEMIIDVLLRLKQRQAAKIMAALPASRAAEVSRIILEPLAQQR